jgi:alpha-1,3-rhamnosyltransferase
MHQDINANIESEEITYSKEPLVSIIVITYNSAKYVLETLESAKDQTYKNIELIISDDCSSDDTIEICRKWINASHNRFIRRELITYDKNTGISANCNRGIKAAKGKWIKFIAGDDSLQKDCIESFIDYLHRNKNNHIDVIHSEMALYKNSFTEINFLSTTNTSKYLFNDLRLNAKDQYLLLLRYVFYIGAPSTFYRSELLKKVNGFDESMPYEDWPLYLKTTKAGYRIYFLDKPTINYRIHSDSIYNSEKDLLFNGFFMKDKVVYEAYRRSYLSVMERLNEDLFYLVRESLYKFGLNKKSFFSKLIFRTTEFIYLKTKRIFRFALEREIVNNLSRNE